MADGLRGLNGVISDLHISLTSLATVASAAAASVGNSAAKIIGANQQAAQSFDAVATKIEKFRNENWAGGYLDLLDKAIVALQKAKQNPSSNANAIYQLQNDVNGLIKIIQTFMPDFAADPYIMKKLKELSPQGSKPAAQPAAQKKGTASGSTTFGLPDVTGAVNTGRLP